MFKLVALRCKQNYMSIFIVIPKFVPLNIGHFINVICSFLGNSRRLSSNCRCFGTHCRFHLHRQVNEVCQWQDCACGIHTCLGWSGELAKPIGSGVSMRGG